MMQIYVLSIERNFLNNEILRYRFYCKSYSIALSFIDEPCKTLKRKILLTHQLVPLNFFWTNAAE